MMNAQNKISAEINREISLDNHFDTNKNCIICGSFQLARISQKKTQKN
jgi:hypothetical protein